MWYKVEVNKDGSVSSCTEVETSVANGLRVYYIEADGKSEALHLALKRYQAYLQSNRDRMRVVRASRIAAGVCRDCGEPSTTSRCRNCNDHENSVRYGGAPKMRRGSRQRMDRQSRYRILLEVQKKAEALSPGSFKAWLRSEIAKVEPGRTQKAA